MEFADEVTQMEAMSVRHLGWKEVKLISASGKSLGSLHMVRQAYDLWDKQKKLLVSRTS